jgi:hypothetical protein
MCLVVLDSSSSGALRLLAGLLVAVEACVEVPLSPQHAQHDEESELEWSPRPRQQQHNSKPKTSTPAITIKIMKRPSFLHHVVSQSSVPVEADQAEQYQRINLSV